MYLSIDPSAFMIESFSKSMRSVKSSLWASAYEIESLVQLPVTSLELTLYIGTP